MMIESKYISKSFYIMGILSILVLGILSTFSLINNIKMITNILGSTKYFALELILVILGWLKVLFSQILIGFAIIGGAEIINLLVKKKNDNQIGAL